MGWTGRVVSVNVGPIREVLFHGAIKTTGIWKDPVQGRVGVHTLGLDGDRQADLENHGGAEKAVYVYATEDAEWWAEQLGMPIPPGTFGQNVDVTGIPINECLIGERWRLGTSTVEIVQPRFPCWKLGLRMGDSRFTKRFLEAARAGAYFRVLEEGSVAGGDRVELLWRPEQAPTVGRIAYLNHANRALAVQLLDAINGAPKEVAS